MSAPNHRYSVKHVLRGTLADVRTHVERCGGVVTSIGLCPSGFTYGGRQPRAAEPPRRVRGKRTRPAFVGGDEHPVIVYVVATQEQHSRIEFGESTEPEPTREERRAAWETLHRPPVQRTR